MTFEITDSYIITKKFSSKDEFCLYIHERVKINKLTYMETIIEFCEEESIDIESISGLIDDSIKNRIRIEAEKENMIKSIPRLDVI